MLAVLFALFVWWFSTGAILWLVGRRGEARTLVVLTSPIFLMGFGLAWLTGPMTGPQGAYLGFMAAILIWGWLELAFLTGVITGPNQSPCPPGVSGWQRFFLAWGTIAHHELALMGASIVLIVLSGDAMNQVALWTFLVLFYARISAKLNVYLGVPNLSHDMMPDRVAHLKSYFAVRRMNWLFPVSVTVLTFAIAFWVERAVAAPEGAQTGFLLLATLCALALVEHWLMVLPIKEAALWKWVTRQGDTGGKLPDPVD